MHALRVAAKPSADGPVAPSSPESPCDEPPSSPCAPAKPPEGLLLHAAVATSSTTRDERLTRVTVANACGTTRAVTVLRRGRDARASPTAHALSTRAVDA